MRDFLRIEGKRTVIDSDKETYDDNICVSLGFACGYNVRIPDEMRQCATRDGQWIFINTTSAFESNKNACTSQPATEDTPFIAINISRFSGCEQTNAEQCANFGFFEVYTPKKGEDFFAFINKVKSRNPNVPSVTDASSTAQYTYISAVDVIPGDRRPIPRTFGYLFDSDGKFNLLVPSDLSRPPSTPKPGLAIGDIINADGTGRVTIRHPGMWSTLTLDLTDTGNPRRN
jgi:hypothetical protein